MKRRRLLAVVLAACHRPKTYGSNVEITRISVVRKDPEGKPTTVDYEFSFVECPGTQIEVIRGDAAFHACASRYKVHDKVPVVIDHLFKDEGRWAWVVKQLGDCPRVPDPNDEASSHTITSRSGSVNGRRWNSTAFTTLKIAVLAPMPSASVTTTAAVKPGRRASDRNVNRTS